MNSSMEIEQASSSSSSSSYPSSPVIQLGGRALDRHNPIICDGRRNITAPNTLLTPPREFSRPPFSPQPHHHQLTKSKKTSSKVNRKIKNKIPFVKHENEEKESSDNLPSTDILKKSSFIPTDIVTRSFAKLSDLVAPPPPPLVGSSRYLLESDTQSQYFDGLPEVDPVYDINPVDDYKELKTEANQDESTSSTTQPTLSQEPKPTPTKQRVSLAWRVVPRLGGSKYIENLLFLLGVTSFKIDYAAKKVTIEGDVTPVGVLASVSKLKHAKFWTSQPPTPPPPPQSPVSTSLTVASTSATTEETPEKQL
ncbi:protein SODIUM POTASSIUM ROOT DEFECTIVE 2-like isoform X2 [Cucumis melo var. makuwa]|uniref:Protein SODIUM POTASSIUM ROOT DEFECTIVE 2-like isoform X2 n=1 Tax=Cucumis melo var. makuwa TaxID=1194695 RepID=A0A5A7TRN7_CUCMM|nr:protein SODIUM POTASSIUM ROOT DEFECTIVE 2-like isoform X2 [Cucumis melo var. makuwa]